MKVTTITRVTSSVRVRTVDDGSGTIEHFLEYRLFANNWRIARDGSVRQFYNVPPPEAK
jgi:hypothetical protein